jgi:hypothetical protein
VPLTNGGIKIVQGVREVFDIQDVPDCEENPTKPETGKIVFIGRNLTGVDFESSFQGMVVHEI